MSHEPDWDALARQFDQVAADAARRDLAERQLGAGDLAAGFSELAKLRHTDEPDYSVAGVGPAYLLYYLPKRAMSAAISVRFFSNRANSARSAIPAPMPKAHQGHV